MYTTRAGLVLGFHGCDHSVVEKVILGKEPLKKSENVHDWLGHGIYFWENSPSRALEFATFLKNHPERSSTSIKHPAVLGAVINLGFTLDLMDYKNLQLVKQGYEVLSSDTSMPLPENLPTRKGDELLIRKLDCAVIQTLHTIREEIGEQPFDSIRGVFWEGGELYPNAGFREKDHIQLCIRNPNCIKGFFLPRELDQNYAKV
jgi:hypothetical protein